MSSRFSSIVGDNRYPRDRSPGKFDRRTPSDTRPNEGAYDQHSSYSARGGTSREPPRGPKAQLGRGGFVPRGRGFGGRGDPRERDFRDDPYTRGKGRGQEWDHRDRYDTRDRRPASPSRARSRSPYREPRDTEEKFRRRDSRDGPVAGTDTFPPRGRGGLRGRGRGDWDATRERGLHSEDRPYDSHSLSRDRGWEPARESEYDQSKREDETRNERERDRDDRFRHDPVPYRSDSRNSFGASRSTSTTDMQPANSDMPSSTTKPITDASNELERRPYIGDGRTGRAGPIRKSERPDPAYRRGEYDRVHSRANSPAPAPSVPAFGSILPQTATRQESTAKPGPGKEVAPPIHPSRRPLLESSKETRPTTSPLLNAPTAPKAQQRPGQDDPPRPAAIMASPKPRSSDGPLELVSNWSKRFPPQTAISSTRAGGTEQPSVRKALEEEGRNGNLPPSPSFKPPVNDTTSQAAPMKIPTGPRAGRGGPPSIRQPMIQQPSIRAPMGRGAPSMMGRGRGQPSTWTWTSPTAARPPPRGPSIMNRMTTKKDVEVNDGKPYATSAPQSQDAIEQWRQKHDATSSVPEQVAEVDLIKARADDPEDGKREEPMKVLQADEAAEKSAAGLSHPRSEKDPAEDNDLDMGLDDDDLQRLQKDFAKKFRSLEARRPPRPSDDPVLQDMLDELDALALAMKEVTENPDAVLALQRCQDSTLEQQVKQDEEEEPDMGSDRLSDDPEPDSIPGTPPLEGLPFLQQSSSNTDSDFGDPRTPNDEDDLIRNLIHARLQDEQDSKHAANQEARDMFSRSFKPWRQNIERIDASAREERAREISTPPDTAVEPTSVPQTARARRIVSDYAMEEIMRESLETAAREDQARRERDEREAQFYIPADSCNLEREAIVPAMLSKAEAQDVMFTDNNDLVQAEDVFDAFRFIPPKDDFSKKEHSDYVYHYVTAPKKFGDIADKLPGRDFKSCVRHYYASKRGISYKNQEQKFLKSGRGKKFREANERAAGSRPRGGLLAAFDSCIEQGAPSSSSLTESGRPRRAAAPTFGEASEAEAAAAAAPTASRRSTFSKDNSMGAQNAERPHMRRGKTATGQKPGRKPKGQQLLAAAPPASQTPSPMKEPQPGNQMFATEPVIEPANEDEREAVQARADMPKSLQGYPVAPTYTEHWAPPPGQVPFANHIVGRETSLPDQAQSSTSSILSQAKPQQSSETTSYWSVPEKQDFVNYLQYFGTDWGKIASTMKTKSQTMIKNYYLREIDPKKGDKGKDLQRLGQIADEKILRKEDMGPMPTPTPAQPKRRYESNATREGQRPLAPVDATNTGDEAQRPIKTRMSPPNLAALNPRFSSSSQAEQKAAASSAQVLAQGPQSPASRGVIHMQQPTQRPQTTHPASLDVSLENSKSLASARHPIESLQRQDNDRPGQSEALSLQARQQQLQQQQRHALAQQLQHDQQRQQQREYQGYLESQRQQDSMRQSDLQQRSDLDAREQEHLRRQQVSSQQRHQMVSRGSVAVDCGPAGPFEHGPPVQLDESSRRVFEHRQEERRRELERLRHQSSRSLAMQPSNGPSPGPIHSRNYSGQSPALPVSLLQGTSSIEPSRSNSVPMATGNTVSANMPPNNPTSQPTQQTKRSNISMLLNSEPEEPKLSKRTSDPRALTGTPEPANAPLRFPPASRPSSEQFVRSETPSQLHGQPLQAISSNQHIAQQQRPDIGLRGGIGRPSQHSLHQHSVLEKSHSHSHTPKIESAFLPPGPRPSIYQSKDGGMVSPHTPHSRTSSYSSLNSVAQRHLAQEPRPSLSEVPQGGKLRPHPYANHPPPQQPSSLQFSSGQPHPLSQREIRSEDLPHRLLDLDHFQSQGSRALQTDISALRSRDPLQRHEVEHERSLRATYLTPQQEVLHKEAALQRREIELQKRQEEEQHFRRLEQQRQQEQALYRERYGTGSLISGSLGELERLARHSEDMRVQRRNEEKRQEESRRDRDRGSKPIWSEERR